MKKHLLSRLSKIEGQIKGIGRMLESDRYCVDILCQVSAVQGALDRVAKETMRQHLERCVAEAFQSEDEMDRSKKINELMEMFSKFGR